MLFSLYNFVINLRGEIMEFIKRMKKREFIEMSLKLTIALLVGIVLIFAMEAMIYGIHIKAMADKDSYGYNNSSVEFYIEKVNKNSYNIYKTDPTAKGFSWDLEKNVSKEKLDKDLYKGGAMRTYNSALYKITSNEDPVNEYVYDEVGHKGAIEAVIEHYGESHDGLLFSVHTRASATATDYTTAYSNLSYDELYKLFKDKPGTIGELPDSRVHWRAPNCFDIYMNWVHYVLMVVFLLAIAGIYAWRFTLIAKEYKKIEKRFKKTGKVFN